MLSLFVMASRVLRAASMDDRHCCDYCITRRNCSTAIIFIISAHLVDIYYSLLWSGSTLRSVELQEQAGRFAYSRSALSVKNLTKASVQKTTIFHVVYLWYQIRILGSRCWVRGTLVWWDKASGRRAGACHKNVSHDLRWLNLPPWSSCVRRN